ncbi:zinc finger MYM-type protein 1-like protein [Tanacetum coccineum]
MRGHDESETSLFKGKFLEVYHFLRDHNEAIRAVTLENAPKNCTLTSPQIQKDVVHCFAKEIVKSICLEIGADVFSLLVDESSDVSKNEQMAIVLRYVDKYGLVKERFVGIFQVKDTSSLTLKAGIDSLLRGQGYDRASNMCGEFNGLKALILKENESAYYKDQNILEAVSLVKGTLRALKQTRASALILPVATATVERCFSKIKLVKTDLRNRMGEEYFYGALVCAIEKEELMNVTNEVVPK